MVDRPSLVYFLPGILLVQVRVGPLELVDPSLMLDGAHLRFDPLAPLIKNLTLLGFAEGDSELLVPQERVDLGCVCESALHFCWTI